MLAGVGLSTNWLSPWAMIPDTVEYSEWKTVCDGRYSLRHLLFCFQIRHGSGGLSRGIRSFADRICRQRGAERRALFGIRAVFTLCPWYSWQGASSLSDSIPSTPRRTAVLTTKSMPVERMADVNHAGKGMNRV